MAEMRIVFVIACLLTSAVGATAFLPNVIQRVDYWCPMHPNERSTVPKACPICKMAMVPIPVHRIGEYRMDVEQVVSRVTRGTSGLRLVFRDPSTSAPVTALETVHERPVHVFIVGRSLDFFAHVHPEELPGGVFEVKHAIPSGEYMVVADFLPRGGSPQTLQRAIVTRGASGGGKVPHLPANILTQTARGVRATLTVDDVVAGKNGHLTFAVADTSGRPVTDLEPYLGAPAHLFIASADLTETTHAHPEVTAAAGSQLEFDVTFPQPGGYRLWLQVQRQGEVITLPFTLIVTS